MGDAGKVLCTLVGEVRLRDENISRKIVAAVRQRPLHQLLEVGPGAGALTKYLLEGEDIAFKAVELDDEKVRYLQETYPTLQGKLIHASILDIDKPFAGK